MINLIKTIHTIIWIIMTTATCYIGYSVIRMNFEILFYISMFLIITETLILTLNSWKCPLTNIARQYSEEDAPNFDIYLPRIIAKYNKEIFSVILFLILILYIYNSMK
jgi:hypothetical protein